MTETARAPAGIGDVAHRGRHVGVKEQTLVQRLISQPGVLGHGRADRHHRADDAILRADAFATGDNFYNITRNFAFIGIMALGMMAVIITGGIDLSVGSIMGLVGVVCGLLLEARHALVRWPSSAASLAGMLAGAVNGVLIAYVGLSLVRRDARHAVHRPLGRDRAVAEPDDLRVRPGRTRLQDRSAAATSSASANPVWVLIVADHRLRASSCKFTTWGRHLYAIGGNEQAARLTGVPVDRVKLQAYIVSGLIGGDRGHPDRRLAGLGHQRARHGLRAAGHRLDRHRRRQPDGRRRRRLWRLHRRGAARGHPQQPADGRASIPTGRAPSSASSSFSRFCSRGSAAGDARDRLPATCAAQD